MDDDDADDDDNNNNDDDDNDDDNDGVTSMLCNTAFLLSQWLPEAKPCSTFLIACRHFYSHCTVSCLFS